MNQSFLLVGAAAQQEVISPNRVKAVTHNLKTAVRLTIQQSQFASECLEELQAAVSHPHGGDLCLTHLSTVKRVSIRKRKEKKKDSLHIHMFCISACMGEDDISFLTKSHLKRANSICTPSCF